MTAAVRPGVRLAEEDHVERRHRLLRLFRSWSSPPDDPRMRRPTDVLLLVGSLVLSIGIGLYFRNRPTTSSPPVSDPGTVADVVDWFADFAYVLVIGWAALLVVLPLFSRGRRRLLLDYLLGAGLTILFGLLVSHSSSGLSESLKQMLSASPPPVDLVGPVAIATAVIVIASRTSRARCAGPAAR